MKTKEVIERARKLCKPYRVTKGKKFRLKDVDPGDTLGLLSGPRPNPGPEALRERHPGAG